MPQIKLDDEAVTWRKVDDDIVAVDLKRSEYLTVNAVARTLWLKLAEGTDESSLVDLLAQEFGLDPARARADVATFLEVLRGRQLLLQ
jgi:hypothetical protein